MLRPRSSQLNERLADIRDFLQGFAEWAEWATSGKAWMTIAQYQDWKRREIIKEKFDIPETQRQVRQLLRQFIKECGFKRLQHSVWMTDKDVVKPLLLLLQRRKLDRWVKIIQGHVLHSFPLEALRAVNRTALNKAAIPNSPRSRLLTK